MKLPDLATKTAFVLCLASALAAGCGPPDEELFQQAEGLYLAGRYQDAIPVLKQFLLGQPAHSGAHLYLGSCYLLSDQWAALAEGELETALYHFRQNGKHSTIPRFSDEYFEVRCYLELLKVQFIRVDAAITEQVPPQILHEVLAQLQRTVAEAQAVAPNDPEVQAMAAEAAKLQSHAPNMHRRVRRAWTSG